jgi:energy-coupling factor transporter ATP-binding protein EcfA2
MLTNVDFNVFFDEYLNLKMYMRNAPHAIQNCLESSGKERTFAAVALKYALRSINNKSKPNIFLMDEVMGKLKGKSVEEFNILLLQLKKKIDKIIIIEHNHNIDYNVLIEVEKSDDGVSRLSILN